jgi:hypothetical protein
LAGKVCIQGERSHTVVEVAPGIYGIDIRQGEEVMLTGASPAL